MSDPLPPGLNPEGTHTGTIRHMGCPHCGEYLELRFKDLVPSSYYDTVLDYVRKAAGNEFVLLPVQTLNLMGEERQRLADEVRRLQRSG